MHTFVVRCLILLFLFPSFCHAARGSGVKLFFKDSRGVDVGFYTGSYALLIGVSNYTAGWLNLEEVPGNLERVDRALKQRGFQTDVVLDPTGIQLKKAFQLFINLYGREKNNRLLFFFSGHAYTGKNNESGYLVPTDAPNPLKDKRDFFQKSLNVEEVVNWSRSMKAKHALFLFDCGLAGSMFHKGALPRHPQPISPVSSHSVRQFLSAGSAGEGVPSQNSFIPFFTKALRGAADIDSDGYITGEELGIYIHERILKYGTGQTPQYGKVKGPDLNFGNFVFQVPGFSGSEKSLLSSRTSKPEADMWELVKESTSLQDIKDFLYSFPDGQFSAAARLKLRKMETQPMFEKGVSHYKNENYREALKWFDKAAQRGHVEAQYRVGLIYDAGKGVKKNRREAVRWFNMAALRRHASAQYEMGLWYSDMDTGEKDPAKALKWFSKAARQGHHEAQDRAALLEKSLETQSSFEKGLTLYKNKNYQEALKWFKKAFDMGHADAQKYMVMAKNARDTENRDAAEAQSFFDKGREYYDSKNYQEALKWFERAFDMGHVDAQKYMVLVKNARDAKQRNASAAQSFFDQGREYYDSKNYQEALKWFEKAAHMGHADARKYMALARNAQKGPGEKEAGFLFEKGLGSYQSNNYEDALKWFKKAAFQGHAGAQNYVGLIYDAGKGVQRDEREAVEWFQRAAERGHKFAQYNTGLQYYEGNQIPEDFPEALKWFSMAAEQGHAGAQNYVGIIYDAGKGVQRDEREAVKWFQRAAEQGHKFAQYNTGLQYYEGNQIPKDFPEALKWFRMAAEQGHTKAQNYLGIMYEKGLGVKPDREKAIKWYSKSAKSGNQDARHALRRLGG